VQRIERPLPERPFRQTRLGTLFHAWVEQRSGKVGTARSLDDARTLAEHDPAVTGGVFTTEVFPFQPMLMGAWPAEAATIPPGA